MSTDRVPGRDCDVDRLDSEWIRRSQQHFETSTGTVAQRLAAFPRYVDRSSLARFVVRYELFRRVLNVQGSIVECGVYRGAGLFAFAQLSALFEPLNHRRRIIGFDTFAGFPSVTDSDSGSAESRIGGISGASESEMRESVELYDVDRPFRDIPKVHLVSGDFLDTGPAFLSANPQLVVSLLYIDFDLREPTAKALELFLPRMPAGAVLAFDEVNVGEWPGETSGLLDVLHLERLHLERMPFTAVSWAILRGDELRTRRK
ncbi:MAG TPA: TylF/MycF/NovP-related O-methyltransferase [Chloroflexota bacterium]|nr:TylF/MycF/NovP-related O-methyltransferase [Chloroflexota bacterium]